MRICLINFSDLSSLVCWYSLFISAPTTPRPQLLVNIHFFINFIYSFRRTAACLVTAKLSLRWAQLWRLVVVSCQSWHSDVFLPLLAWDDLNVSYFSYFQEHSEYSLAHLDEMMLLLHGMKSALDNTVLENQLLCYQHLLVHMIKVGWHFFPFDHNVICI